MKMYVMLVGLPGTGKSTWVKKFERKLGNNYTYLSTDYFIEKKAEALGVTYNDIFTSYIKAATIHLMETMQGAFSRGDLMIIHDQTNVSVETRRKKLLAVPKDYRKIAVYFELNDDVEHTRRLNRPGKHIPKNVLDMMKNTYTRPDYFEGFYEIYSSEDSLTTVFPNV